MDPAKMSTEELEQILREDASRGNTEPDMELLMPIMEELARRRREVNPDTKTPEEAFQIFLEKYASEDMKKVYKAKE